MIGIDTNVLVRIFADDDARQAASAARVIDESGPEQIFVNVDRAGRIRLDDAARLQVG